MFGGRRLATYSVNEGATSINYVFGGLLCILPSIYWLFTSRPEDRGGQSGALADLALIHVGTTAFTLFSFFIFPLGAGRVGYLSQLLLIPILPSVIHRRSGGVALGLSSLLLLYVLYLIGKACTDGTFDIFLGIDPV
jgi:hypothetical protein